jgi:hypothetical protein
MNGAPAAGKGSGQGFPQMMVDQTPKYDNQVWSRKGKIYRPTKKKKKVKFL